MPIWLNEWWLPYRDGAGIQISADRIISVLLRDENNLLQVNDNDELYCDLQLGRNLSPSDDLPVGVTVWKVQQSKWWIQNGLLLSYKTTSGDYARRLYGSDKKLYFNDGWAERKQLYYANDIDGMFSTLRWELATVAWTWDFNDLINRPEFIQLQSDWDQTDTDSPDYIKNKPTELSDFNNDLSLSDFPDDLRYEDYVVTPQEYADLPDSKNSDGKLYLIHD